MKCIHLYSSVGYHPLWIDIRLPDCDRYQLTGKQFTFINRYKGPLYISLFTLSTQVRLYLSSKPTGIGSVYWLGLLCSFQLFTAFKSLSVTLCFFRFLSTEKQWGQELDIYSLFIECWVQSHQWVDAVNLSINYCLCWKKISQLN